MASLNLAPEQLKQLELVRNRFVQLTSSLSSLRANVLNSNPLPTRESLQASASILQHNIQSIQDLTTENAALFQRIAIHPSTNFPGRTQEHVLLQLLRKKLEPAVESWVEEARDTARSAGLDASKLASATGGANRYNDEDDYDLDQEEDVPSDPFNEQWADIRDAFQESLQQYVTVQVKKKYTVEEQAVGIENVRTGLKRDLEESDDEEDEDEDEDEEEASSDSDEESAVAQGGRAAGAGAPAAGAGKIMMRPEHVFWLAVQGDIDIPPNVDFESRRRETRPTKRPAPPR
ncbi:hypothetical protein BT67DRAFT_398019 [Trichocladium antarcticum]|uniref:Mediator of RNA polymerase II transcription subunit 8 n=1 Tax=Trichocladium antarcticum TaxID=1450529 RepID=A0AAN6URP8_9PEZI|nr:hypothetical protein BT67DRAFT_398019 [Trichocladium antarcticum]